MTEKLSPSGARIRGDDYQHVVAWLQVLRVLQPNSGIVAVGIEDPDAGNADDVTVYMADGRRECYQVKASVDARQEIGVEWLTAPSRAGGPSILQRFYTLWRNDGLKSGRLKIIVMSNRPAAANDPVMKLRDGKDGTIARALAATEIDSKVACVRGELATLLNTTEEELLRFLGDVSFRLGRIEDELKEDTRLLMYSSGLRYDDEAIAHGISMVRQWVTDGKRRLSTAELCQAVEPLRRPEEGPAASLLIQAINRDPTPEGASIVLDWVDLFKGDEPRSRRVPHNPAFWDNRFRPEIREAVQTLRAQGHTRVLVRGYMRLPAWFTTGVELGRTAGFEIVSLQRGVPWTSQGDVAGYLIRVASDQELSNSKELAIGLALAADPSEDVLSFIRQELPHVGRYICINPERGSGNQAIRTAGEARGWAYGARDMVRNIVRKYKPPKLHLFLATPHGAALLLGHLWDRMPPTQLYEDLGAIGGYEPSFLIPN